MALRSGRCAPGLPGGVEGGGGTGVRATIREAMAITFWTGWTTGVGAFLLATVAKVPFGVTFLLGVLTVGPVLAIWRGRDRERDPLDLGQRAAAESIALAILLALGTYLSHRFG